LASEVARMLRRGVSTHTGDKERREKKKAKLEWTPAAAGEADEEAAGKRKAGAEEGSAKKKVKKRKSEAGAPASWAL